MAAARGTGPRPRKVPMRTCVGCRSVRPKRELVRIVRGPDGTVSVDATGKRPGRGAYICPTSECLEKARKGRQLERALDRALDEGLYQALAEQVAGRAASGP